MNADAAAEPLEAKLQDALSLLDRPAEVRVVDSEKCFASAPVFFGPVKASRGFVEALDAEALAWVLAHESAHMHHQTDELSRWRVATYGLAVTVLAAAPVAGLIGTAPAYAAVGVLMVLFVLVVLRTFQAMRRQELVCDRHATMLVGSQAAVRALETAAHVDLPRLIAAHPPMTERIVACRDLHSGKCDGTLTV